MAAAFSVVDMDICCEDDSANDDQSKIVVQVKADRSLEESRAEVYEANAAVSDTYNTFQFWREPVACLVLPELTSSQATDNDAKVTADESSSNQTLSQKPSSEVVDDGDGDDDDDDGDEEGMEMEIEPLFSDFDDFEDNRVEELQKLENHLKRVLDKGSQEMDHLTKELSEAKLNSGGI